jgi:hypothetical protein
MTNLAEKVLRIPQYKLRIGSTETRYVDVNKVLNVVHAEENGVTTSRETTIWNPVPLDTSLFVYIYG